MQLLQLDACCRIAALIIQCIWRSINIAPAPPTMRSARQPWCDHTSHVAHVQAPLLHCCSLVVVMGQNVFRYIEIIYYPETYIKIISIITVIFNTCLFLCVSKWVCSSDAYSTDVRMNFTDYRQFVPGVIRRPVHGRTPAVVPCTRNRQNDKVVWCRRQFTAGL